MLPTPGALFTSMTPSRTNQRAGVWSCAETHSFRFLPSKRMIASDGAAPAVAPGVTTGGTGAQTSVSFGFGWAACCATAIALQASSIEVANSLEVTPEVLIFEL